MKKILILSHLLIFSSIAQSAISHRQVVTNYTDKDYKAKFQNWDISQDNLGRIWVANGEGILVFDGTIWNSLPQAMIVRSVHCNEDKIYLGMFQEFGYLTATSDGTFSYRSLSSQLPDKNIPKDEEIWKIISWKDKILFQSFTHIYGYDPLEDKIELMSDSIYHDTEGDGHLKPLFCYVAGEELYAQRINGGFYKYTSKGWLRLWKEFQNHVMGISLPPSADSRLNDLPDGTLLFTQTAGVYEIKKGYPEKLSTEIDRELKESQINRVIEDQDNTIFIGTIGKGLFQVTRKGEQVDIWDISSGLNNNTILGLFRDKEQNIWVALDDGVSLIHRGIKLEQIHPFSESIIYGLGTGYGLGKHNGKLVLATNQGAYIENQDDFSFIEGTGGQNWFVKTFDTQTFIGGNDQTVVINENNEKTILPFSGTDIKKVTIHGNDILLQSTYFTLEVYIKDPKGQWNYSHSVNGVEMPIRHIEVDSDGTIWAAHWTKGLLKLQLTPDLNRVKLKTYFPSLTGDNIEKPVYFIKLRGKTVFTEGNGFYDYNEIHNNFVDAPRLGNLNKLPHIRDAWSIDDNRYWIAGADSYHLVAYEKDRFTIKYSVPLEIFPRKNNGDNSSVFIERDTTYFIVNDRIGKVRLSEISDISPTFPLSIRKIGSYNSQSQLVAMPIATKTTPHTEFDNFSVEMSYPNYAGVPVKYHFSLDNGSETLDSVSMNPYIFYPELKWGFHIFKCSVLDLNNTPIQELEYKFYIDRPWPFRWWAILIYCVSLVGLFYLFSRLISIRKLNKQLEIFEKEEAEKNLKIHEQSLLIAHQEKLLLESQLSEKSKELASMALSEYGHRQILDNLHASLDDARKKGKDVTEVEKLLKEIVKNESDTRVFWNMFEKNFDLIHEHFFRNLRKAYPSLTPADMKFCALLRMNMTTKEISRFTNLSIRGVETARYRLRKKFELTANQSLVQFLIDFNME